jgi:hypothetical protein
MLKKHHTVFIRDFKSRAIQRHQKWWAMDTKAWNYSEDAAIPFLFLPGHAVALQTGLPTSQGNDYCL